MKSAVFIAAITFVMAGCTSISVDPLDAQYAPNLICIEFNPDVIVDGFEEAIVERIEHHGIEARMVEGNMPPDCQYTLEYTALKNWDMGLYLHYAELHLKLDGREVAEATYRLRNKGGLSLFKWQDVKTKMDPVVDQLLGAESTSS